MRQRNFPCPQCGKIRATSQGPETTCRDCYYLQIRQSHTWDNIAHGTAKGYNQHCDWKIPHTPECGCSVAKGDHNRRQRHARTEHKAMCWKCKDRRGVRDDRGGLCAKCWFKEGQMLRREESEPVLEHGRWVARGGVQVWERDETA